MLCAGIGVFRQIKKNESNQLQICLARTSAGHESMLKGKRKKHEKVLECAYRETQEESGITPIMIKLFDTDALFFIENSITYFVGVFIGSSDFVPHPEDPEELASTEWYNVDDVLKFNDFRLKKRRKEIINEMSKLVKKYYS